MVLRRTKKFLWKDGVGRLFYSCIRWPKCQATHGAHPDGRPLGVPGNKETKAARIRAHAALEPFVKKYGRKAVYVVLGKALGIPEDRVQKDCHIGMFDVATCEKVVEICTRKAGGELG